MICDLLPAEVLDMELINTFSKARLSAIYLFSYFASDWRIKPFIVNSGVEKIKLGNGVMAVSIEK